MSFGVVIHPGEIAFHILGLIVISKKLAYIVTEEHHVIVAYTAMKNEF